jgi:DNA-binding IclR family transcriptional regulator
MQALARSGYLERGADGYRVGSRVAALVPRSRIVVDDAVPHLYVLAAGIKLAVSFGVAEESQLVTVVSARPPVRYCSCQIPSAREPMHATAMGKTLLAFAPGGPAAAVARLGILKPYTVRTHTSPAALTADLGKVRRSGFAVSDEERTDGVRAIAVPVFAGERPVGALGVQARSKRLTDELLTSTLPALRHFAGEVGRRIQLAGPTA